jgi:ribonuclease P protein component
MSDNKEWGETLGRAERLTLKKRIEELMAAGQSLKMPGMTLVFKPMELPTPFPAQVMFSASKRNFKRSHDRNRIKRLMREGYRKQKHIVYSFLSERKTQCAMLFIFTGKYIPEQEAIRSKIFILLRRLTEATINEREQFEQHDQNKSSAPNS